MSDKTIPERSSHMSARKFAFGLLGLLLALDLTLIWLHVQRAEDNWLWDIEADGGFGERLQYLKWAAATILLLLLAWKRQAAIYCVWAALFLYLLIDDSQSLHEAAGARLVSPLGLGKFEEFYHQNFEFFFLRAEDFGELILALAVASAVAIALYFFWPDGKAMRDKAVTKWLVAWLLVFAFFAVGADMLHIMAWEIYPPAIDMLTLVEEGGEMICASLLVGGLALELSRT